jgi:hypothetical protein
MTVKVGDLQDQTMSGNVVKPQPFLYCQLCDAEYSANKGDYWDAADEHEFTHCGEPMHLVRKHVVYEKVNKP